MTAKNKSKFAVSMFEAIKTSLNQKERTGGNINYRDILRFESGNTYLVRLVPDVKNPEKTFFHYFNHGWTSVATGQFTSAICPTTFNDSCPLCQERFKIWRSGTEQEKDAARALRRRENWMVNVYVISDPINPDNEGKVKIMRYGAQLNKKIEAAINGDDAEEFGARIFDMSENGCTLRVKAEPIAENNRSWTNYTDSRFLNPSEIPGMTDDKIKEIHSSVHNLENLEEKHSYNDLKEMLNTHYFAKVAPVKAVVVAPAEEPEEEEDEIDVTPPEETPEVVTTTKEVTEDKALDELLAGL